MAKTKTAFFCQNCGTQYSKWQGQCYACKEWNTIVEEVIQKEEKTQWSQSSEKTPLSKQTNKYIPLWEICNPYRRRTRNRKKYIITTNCYKITLQNALCIGGRKPKTNKNEGRTYFYLL